MLLSEFIKSKIILSIQYVSYAGWKKQRQISSNYRMLCITLNPQGHIYYEVALHAIIENAQKNLLTVADATAALLFSALRQY